MLRNTLCRYWFRVDQPFFWHAGIFVNQTIFLFALSNQYFIEQVVVTALKLQASIQFSSVVCIWCLYINDINTQHINNIWHFHNCQSRLELKIILLILQPTSCMHYHWNFVPKGMPGQDWAVGWKWGCMDYKLPRALTALEASRSLSEQAGHKQADWEQKSAVNHKNSLSNTQGVCGWAKPHWGLESWRQMDVKLGGRLQWAYLCSLQIPWKGWKGN